jgi:hypothetical protein
MRRVELIPNEEEAYVVTCEETTRGNGGVAGAGEEITVDRECEPRSYHRHRRRRSPR